MDAKKAFEMFLKEEVKTEGASFAEINKVNEDFYMLKYELFRQGFIQGFNHAYNVPEGSMETPTTLPRIEHVVADEGETYKLTIQLFGDIGGDGQYNRLIFEGDQFDILNNKTILDFYGAWELHAFFSLVEKVKGLFHIEKH